MGIPPARMASPAALTLERAKALANAHRPLDYRIGGQLVRCLAIAIEKVALDGFALT
jgi:hypothetical protein